MIVAYDLRYACDHFAGIGKHTHALLQALLELPGDERYLVLWNPGWRNTRFDLAPFRAHPRVEWVERRWHPIRPWGAVQVGAWLRRRRPSVYLSPFGLRPIASGCPEVLTLHDVSALRTPHIPSPVAGLLYRLSLRLAARARAIITVSEFSRREVLALTPARPERVRAVLGGALPHPPEAARRRPPRLRAERFALVVGDNRPRKNLGSLARAWAAMGADPALPLVGAGPVDARFPSLAGLAERAGARGVEQLGWLEPPELAWLFDHAELVLLPSLYEGFGIPLVEAFAAGVPAVVADIPVFHEVGGDAAAYADPRDPAAWAREVARLAGDPAARERMRRAGRARAAELTYRRTAEATLAVLREAAGVGA